MNEEIRVTPIRVISDDGEQLGILSTEEAMALAQDKELDLVEIVPQDSPPVCRIMDYGKHRYQQGKKKQKGHTHQTKLKEIRLRPKTGKHDIDFKLKKAIGFLQHRDKVQVSVIYRGRENAHIDEGRKVMDRVVAELAEYGKIEQPPQQQGRRMICTIAPK